MSLRPVALALASFLGTAALVRMITSPPRSELSAKVDAYCEAADAIDVLFVGDSLTHRSVVPDVLDPVLGKKGFNLGVPGANGYEMELALRRALACGDPEVVVFQLDSFTPVIPEKYLGTRRTTDWHDAVETVLVLPEAWEARKARELVPLHLREWLVRLVSAGMGPSVWVERAERAQWEDFAARVRTTRGYVPLEGDPLAREERRDRFLGHVDTWLLKVEERRKDRRNRKAIRRGHPRPEHLLRVRGRIEADGARAVFVAYPGEEVWPGSERLAPDVVPVLLAFDDPGAHPEWFRPENHFDEAHLTAEAAGRFSEALGRALEQAL